MTTRSRGKNPREGRETGERRGSWREAWAVGQRGLNGVNGEEGVAEEGKVTERAHSLLKQRHFKRETYLEE